MGWFYNNGGSRKDLVEELVESRERTTDQGVVVTTTCLAHCYRGGVFSGSLWAVWERTFLKDGEQVEQTHRWITCDLVQCYRGDWGYKPLDESMHPYYFSCPLGYLEKVPLDQYGGNAEWREGVQRYHARQAEKRQAKRMAVR